MKNRRTRSFRTAFQIEEVELRLMLTGNVLIDDFNDPQTPISLTQSGSDDSTVTGNMLGGTRFIDLFFDTSSQGSNTSAGVADGFYSLNFSNTPGAFGASGAIYTAPVDSPFDFSDSTFFQLDLGDADPSVPYTPGAIDLTLFGGDTLGGFGAVTEVLDSNEGTVSIPTDALNFDLSSVAEIGISFASFAPNPSTITIDTFSAVGDSIVEDPTIPFDFNGNLVEGDTYLPLGPNHDLVKSQVDVSISGAGIIDPVQSFGDLSDGDIVDFQLNLDATIGLTITDIDPDNDFENLGNEFTLPSQDASFSMQQMLTVDVTRPNLGIVPHLDSIGFGDLTFPLPSGGTLSIDDLNLFNGLDTQTNGANITSHFDSGFFSTGEITTPDDVILPIIVAPEGDLQVTENKVVSPAPLIEAPSVIKVTENSEYFIDTIQLHERIPSDETVNVAISPFNTDSFTFAGTTSLATIDGLTFFDGDGTEDQNVFFSGSVSQINNALDGLTLQIGGIQTGNNVLNVVVSDGDQSFVNFVEIPLNLNSDTINANPDEISTVEGGGVLEIPVLSNDQVLDTSSTISISAINGSVVEQGQSVTLPSGAQTEVKGSTITYTPPSAEFFGTDTFSYTIQDEGIPTVSDTDIVSINLQPVNDAPVLSLTKSLTVDEGSTLNIGDSLAVNDDSNQDIILSLVSQRGTLTIPDAAGVTISGNSPGAKTLRGSIDAVNGALDTVTYTPLPDSGGTDMVQVVSADLGGTGAGGPMSVSDSITITIQPINDGPVNTVPSANQSIDEDNSLVFSGANSNLIQVQDIDSDLLTVQLNVPQGILNSPSGETIVSNNTSGSPTLTGNSAQINAALNGLTYTPPEDFFGNLELTVRTTDEGNQSDTDTISITISPINDPPLLVVPGKQSFFTDFDNRFSSDPAPFKIDDVDVGSGDVEIDFTISSGTLSVPPKDGVVVSPNPGGINGVRVRGGIGDVNDAIQQLSYVPTVSGNETLNILVNDLGNTGDGDSGTANATVEVEVLDFVPVDIIGQVFIDSDNDKTADSNEPGIEGVDVILSGTDFQGNTISISDTTNTLGQYEFLDVRPNQPGSPYTITQESPELIQVDLNAQVDALVEVSPLGETTTQDSLSFPKLGLESPFEQLFDPTSPNVDSAILVGFLDDAQIWSIVLGNGWDRGRYSNPRLSPTNGGSSATLTVFDAQSGSDKSATVSQAAGTLVFIDSAEGRVYRVIGSDELVDEDRPKLVGDADGDGLVGTSDFMALSSAFGKENATLADGDFDGNGKVEFADFLLLSANFGKRLPAAPLTQVVSDSAVDLFFAVEEDDDASNVTT